MFSWLWTSVPILRSQRAVSDSCVHHSECFLHYYLILTIWRFTVSSNLQIRCWEPWLSLDTQEPESHLEASDSTAHALGIELCCRIGIFYVREVRSISTPSASLWEARPLVNGYIEPHDLLPWPRARHSQGARVPAECTGLRTGAKARSRDGGQDHK